MSKSVLAAFLFFLCSVMSYADAPDVAPELLKKYYSVPLIFNGKRMENKTGVTGVSFFNDQKVASWKGTAGNKPAEFTVHWGQDGDVLWLNEVQEFVGKKGSGLLARTTTFENGKVNSATFCRGTKEVTLKISDVKVNCSTSNRYTCDALFAAYGNELKNPDGGISGKTKEELVALGVACKDSMKEKKCVALANSYKNIIVLLKQEAAKTQKEIQADMDRMQSKMEAIFGQWSQVKVTSLMAAKSLEKMSASLGDPEGTMETMGYINTAIAQCQTANSDLNNIKAKAPSGGSKGAPIPPAGGVK